VSDEDLILALESVFARST